MSTERRRNRTLLVATFLVFFVPIVGAWLLNIFVPDWRPFGTLNHGTLVQPVRSVSAEGLAHLDGRLLESGYLSGRWTLVHLAVGECRQICIAALERSRQIQQALGDDMSRVQLLLVLTVTEGAETPKVPRGVTVAGADPDWLASFSFADSDPDQRLGIYLVDPQGYLMMRYAPDVERRGLLADLERLLKISKIG
jgi:cytochrome oxidase Cu insertion factor (SCO1/SenC/PrrC family)